MANRTGQSNDMPKIDTRVGVSAATPRVRYSTTSSAAQNAGEPAVQLAQNLLSVSSRMEDRLDVIARDKGAQAGIEEASRRDVALRRDSTIRGAAFDAAAIRTMQARHDTSARVRAEEIYQQHKDDPAALQKNLQDYKNGVLASQLPAEVKADFENSYKRISTAYMSDAQSRLEARQMDADRAAALADFDERRRTIEKLSRLAETDEEAAVSLALEVEDLKKAAIGHGPRGAFVLDGVEYPADPTRGGSMDLEAIQKLVLDTADVAREGRIVGKFMNTGGLSAKQEFLEAFNQEFAGGENDFTIEQYDRLSSRMRAEISRMEAASNGELRLVEKGIRNAQELIEKGYNPGEENMRALEGRAAMTGDPVAVDAARQMRGLFTFQNEARAWRPDELQTWINSEQSRLNEQGEVNLFEAGRLDMAGKLLTSMKAEIERDPLSWGNRVGLVSMQPVNPADPATLEKRLSDATTIAEHYGTDMQLLTDEEVTQFKTAYDAADADGRAGIIAALSQGFGNDAVHAFADISKVSPSLANVGGLVGQSVAHEVTARDYAAGDAAMASGAGIIPQGLQVSDRQKTVLGNAYGFAPGAGEAVKETAERIYTARALRKGLTKDQFDEKLYDRALQEAAGAWWDRSGRRHGGILEQKKGHSVILPPNMTENAFEDLIDSVTEDDLIAASVGGGAPVHANGKPLSPEDFRRAYLISSGPGRYVVSTVNPAKSPQPVFVQGTNQDGFFEIDLLKLQGGR